MLKMEFAGARLQSIHISTSSEREFVECACGRAHARTYRRAPIFGCCDAPLVWRSTCASTARPIDLQRLDSAPICYSRFTATPPSFFVFFFFCSAFAAGTVLVPENTRHFTVQGYWHYPVNATRAGRTSYFVPSRFREAVLSQHQGCYPDSSGSSSTLIFIMAGSR